MWRIRKSKPGNMLHGFTGSHNYYQHMQLVKERRFAAYGRRESLKMGVKLEAFITSTCKSEPHRFWRYVLYVWVSGDFITITKSSWDASAMRWSIKQRACSERKNGYDPKTAMFRGWLENDCEMLREIPCQWYTVPPPCDNYSLHSRDIPLSTYSDEDASTTQLCNTRVLFEEE